MNTNSKNNRLQVNERVEKISCEISSDFILPDRYPDVKKLLWVKAKPSINSRYIQGDRLEIMGIVEYSVLFCADTEGGEEIHSVHFKKEFESALTGINNGEDSEISVIPRISLANVKLANPRKVTLRSVVDSDIKICVIHEAMPKFEGDFKRGNAPKAEQLWEEKTVKRQRTFLSEPLQISEIIEPDGHQPPIEAIVDCDAALRFWEVKPMKNSGHLTVSLKGDIIVNCLYKAQSEENTYRSFSRKIPHTSQIDCDEFADFFATCNDGTLDAYATADITHISAVIGENSYGEKKAVDLQITADISTHLIGSEKVSLCTDSYLVDYESECISKELDCETPGKVILTSFSVGESLSREEVRLHDGITVIDQRIELSPAAVTVERGRAHLTAEATVCCIFSDSEKGFTSREFKVPVKFDTNVGDIGEKTAYNCELAASDLRVGLGNDRISFDFEMSLAAELYGRENKKVLDIIRITEKKAAPKKDASITLCYPVSGDTLWEIAKRYNTTRSEIEKSNTPESKILLIPNRTNL